MPVEKLDLEAVGKAVDEIKTGFEEFKKTAEDREKDLATKGSVDVLIESKLTAINASIDANQVIVDQLYAASKRKNIFLDGKQVDVEELNAKSQQWADRMARERGLGKAADFGHEAMGEYKSAFASMMRKEAGVLTPDEIKALSVGSDPDGGYTVDPDTSGRMVKRIYETSLVRQHANVQVISTDAMEGLYDLGEASSGWVGETAARTETGTPQIGKWRIPVHEQYAEPRTTQKLLDDSYFNAEAWLADKVADKMARTENTAFVTGDGVNQPRGFMTYADGTTLPGTIEQFSTGVSGDFAADPAGGDKLIEMVYGLKGQYRNNASWFMNRTTMGQVRLLKDSNGNWLWQPSLAAGQPSTLVGYALIEMADIADMAASSLSIAFADMGEAYQIVDRQGTRILRDPYTAKPYVKFYTTRRVGGDVLNFEAVKILKFA